MRVVRIASVVALLFSTFTDQNIRGVPGEGGRLWALISLHGTGRFPAAGVEGGGIRDESGGVHRVIITC